MPTMRRSCTSTVSGPCLVQVGGWVWHHPILASPSCLSLPTTPAKDTFLQPLYFSFCFASQSPHTSHIPGPPKLWRPAAGGPSLCQGAGCKKRHSGEKSGSRQAGFKSCFFDSLAS